VARRGRLVAGRPAMKAAFSGVRAWLVQRATAIVLLVFVLYLLLKLLLDAPTGAPAWRQWLLSPGMRSGLLLMFISLALHAWVGTRDVVIDYVKPLYARLAVLGLVVGSLLAVVVYAAALLFPL
jgi:succinate dehydrogenase / fumarate reductase membrane anchor subunit